tara:strand:+ start:638 stop:1402 length:765 start_codon:yes stop_codon:yes gene_type:complete
MKYHYMEQSLIAPVHKVTIAVIGAGGTGSSVLAILGRMNAGLIGLGHPGFFVRCYDPDEVSQANIGRQLFSETDLGKFKSDVTIERINRFYSTNWDSIPKEFEIDFEKPRISYNIIITCVDNVQIRRDIQKVKTKLRTEQPYNTCYYWLDFGNGNNYGQAILGTMGHINQPEGAKCITMPTIIEMEKTLGKLIDNDDSPSCSTLEALNRQDLLVNSTLAEFGMNLLWKLFRQYRTSQNGIFMNLDKMIVNPIKL